MRRANQFCCAAKLRVSSGCRDFRNRLASRKLALQLNEEALAFLLEKGFDTIYGARNLRRTTERYLENPLAEEILRGHITEGEAIEVSVAADALRFTQQTSAAK